MDDCLHEGDGGLWHHPKELSCKSSQASSTGLSWVVMQYYKRFMQRYEPDIWYNVSRATAKKIALEMENEEDERDNSEDVEAEPSSVDIPSSTPDNSGLKAHLVYSSEMRKDAMEKKNKRQEKKAKQALKQCGQAAVKSGVSPGAVVTLKVDYRTYYNPEGLVAIVYEFDPETGGLKLVVNRELSPMMEVRVCMWCQWIDTPSTLQRVCLSPFLRSWLKCARR